MLQTINLPGRWVLEIDPERAYFKLYHTNPDTGQEDLYSIQPGERRHESLPAWQPLVHEVARPDGTIGVVNPLVVKYKGQWYIAVSRNERHAGVKVEAARKSWSNPSELPLEVGVKVETFDLGRGDSNTARIVGGDGIQMNLSVITGNGSLPGLPGKLFWMKFYTFGKEHSDNMGAAAIGKAFMEGVIS
jgi:hypothetical protein